MSIRRNARGRAVPAAAALDDGSAFGLGLRFFFLLVAFILIPPSSPEASETVVVRVTLNQEEKGDYFVQLLEDGDFLVRRSDLLGMGLLGWVLEAQGAEETRVEGEAYVRLGSLRGVEVRFDEATLTVEMTAPPSMLPASAVDLMRTARREAYRPRDNSFFLNYALEYSDSEAPDTEALTLGNELGVKVRDVLFLTDTLYARRDEEEDFVRLTSSLTYDWRDRMQRLVVGDFVASAGVLGSSVPVGGVSFSKQYRINPYLIKYPLPAVRGVVATPSEVEVYVNGVRAYTGRFSPGEFELSNISSFGGAGAVEVVLTDSFGRRQRLLYPFYLTTRLLREGYNDYGYGAGFLRESLGVESNRYGDPVFSAYHDRGVRDWLTLGFAAEGSEDAYHFGPQSYFRAGNAGVVSLALAASRDGGRWGEAGLLGYEYQGRTMSGTLGLSAFSRDYTNLSRALAGGESARDRTRYSLGAGIGMSGGAWGSVALSAGVVDKFDGQDRSTYAVAYSKSLSMRTIFSARFTHVREEDSTYTVFFGITHRFPGDVYLTAETEHGEDENTQRLQVRNSEPAGEGLGYRVILDRAEEDSGARYAFNPMLNYNARFGRYGAEYLWSELDGGQTTRAYRLRAAGGIAYVGGVMGLSRPIRDSFGLVRVGGLEGIGVFVNNRQVGATDSEGKVFAPELSSYINNQVSISDENVPIDYTLSKVLMDVSPSLRSGAVVDFEAKRLRAATGRLFAKEDGRLRPLEYGDLGITVDGKETTYPTGRGGEFYVEDVSAGAYAASVEQGGKKYAFTLEVPDTGEAFVDLGDIVVEAVPEKESREGDPREAPAQENEASPEGEGSGAEGRHPEGDILGEVPLGERPFVLKDEPALPPVEAGFVFRDFADYEALVGTVHFHPGADRIRDEDSAVIDRVFRLLDYNLILRAEIEGYTDPAGDKDYNYALGLRRANRVKERLMAHGIPEWKFVRVASLGEGRLLCEGLDETCRRRNQRAVVKLVLRGEETTPPDQ